MNRIFRHGEKQTASNLLSAKPDFHLLKSSSRQNDKTARDPFFADAKTLTWTFFQATRLAPIAAGKVHGLLQNPEMLGTSEVNLPLTEAWACLYPRATSPVMGRGK